MLASIVSALRPGLASHPNLGEKGDPEPSGAPICSQLYDQDNDKSIYCSYEVAFIRVKHKDKNCTQKSQVT